MLLCINLDLLFLYCPFPSSLAVDGGDSIVFILQDKPEPPPEGRLPDATQGTVRKYLWYC